MLGPRASVGIVTGMADLDQRLGTLERRVNSVDQRLERVEGKQDAMLAWQQAHSERVTAWEHASTRWRSW